MDSDFVAGSREHFLRAIQVIFYFSVSLLALELVGPFFWPGMWQPETGITFACIGVGIGGLFAVILLALAANRCPEEQASDE